MDAPDPPVDEPSVGPTDSAVREPAATPTWSDRATAAVRRTAPTGVVIGLLAALAVRRYIGISNADALLPALMSTQQWTLFYWGQDRLANLVALVALPIRDPIWNFEIQSLVIASAFFGVGAIFVSYHAWARREQPSPLEHAVATGLTGLLVMAPMHVIAGYRFAIEQLYFLSVVVWLGAVWAWHRRHHYVLGGVLVQIATLVNPSLLAASPLVWFLDDRRDGRLRRCAGFVGVSLGAFVVTDIAARFFAAGADVDHPYDEFRFEHLDTGVRAVAGNIAGSMRDHLATTVVVAAVAVVAFSLRRLGPRRAVIYGVLPIFSAAWFLAFSINGWVIMNLHEFRYFYPLYITFVLFVAGAVTEIVLASRRWRPSFAQPMRRARTVVAIEIVAVAATAALALVTAHRTEVTAVTSAADQVAAAREFDARLVAGNYWNVWPSVVVGRAEDLPLLGVTYRSDPIEDEIRAELDDADDRAGSAAVVCAAVDAAACVDIVNDRSDRTWAVDEVLKDWPLVIRIVPAP